MPGFFSNMIGSFMAEDDGENTTKEHLTHAADGAAWRLDDDSTAMRRKGFHKQHVHARGTPEVPRQYNVSTHGSERDLALNAGNSYSSAIAVQELIKRRGF